MNPSSPAAPAAREGPLTGVRVLDLSRVLAGPFCSMILGDLGAEVIKVEELGKGDQTRTIPPFKSGESHYFLAINRNKRSVAVDMKTAAGRELVLRLCRRSDVVVENFRPGVLERLGLGYADLAAVKPDLIMCSISGFGQTGPLRTTASFDLITQAMSGVMSINGEADGPPTKLGLPMGDIGGGMWAAIGALSGLQHRQRTGKGLHVDLSLLDGLMGLLGYLAELHFFTGENPGRVGSSHHSIVPYGRFEVKDGHMVLALHVGSFWRKFCSAIDREDLIQDPRFRTTADRSAHRAELEAMVTAVLKTRSAAEWHKLLEDADVPHGPVNSIGEALAQPVVAARGLIKTVQHPHAGAVRVVGSPLNFGDQFADAPYTPAPLLGADTVAVLADLGYTAADIESMRAAGVIAPADTGAHPTQD
jgi:crotonobetainyl-CoA:carnitine CoA-transferase CaiB-like acyl-CoA transferase